MTAARKLRFGIAGMGSDHVWAMADGLARLPEVDVVAGADDHAELRDQATKRWGLAHTYADVEKMLDGEQLDAILVCGDNASKADIAEAAAKRGVNVYQDKPMAATLAQADRILKAVESSGITLMVAYHSAFSPIYDQVKQLIADGAIGKPYLARGVIGHGGPKEFGCSEYFCEWLFDKRRNGGGTFIDEACYPLNGFIDYLGDITEVSAFMTQMGHRDYLPSDVEDNSVAIFRFANGALGVIDSKWGQVGPMPFRSSYHGHQGTILAGGTTELLTTASPTVPQGWEPIDLAGRAAHGRVPEGLRGWRSPAGAGGSGSGGLEQRYFVDCLLNKRPIEGAASPRSARKTQEVIEATYRSAESGKTVRLPLT